jgi:hypothetical protein
MGRSGYFWGGLLVVIGVIALLGNLHLLNNLDWNYLWPVILIGLGVWLMAVRMLPGRAETYGGAVDHSDLKESLSRATLQVGLGSARIDVRSAPLGEQLYRAHIEHRGHAPDVQLERQTGTVRIAHTGTWMLEGWGRVKLDVQLSDSLPWAIDLDCGSLKGGVDLRSGKLSAFESEAGSARLDLDVPRPGGQVPIRLEGGSVRANIRRSRGAAARVNASGGSISVTADGARQGGFGQVSWSTPGADTAPDRYEMRFSGGSVKVDLEQGQ